MVSGPRMLPLVTYDRGSDCVPESHYPPGDDDDGPSDPHQGGAEASRDVHLLVADAASLPAAPGPKRDKQYGGEHRKAE